MLRIATILPVVAVASLTTAEFALSTHAEGIISSNSLQATRGLSIINDSGVREGRELSPEEAEEPKGSKKSKAPKKGKDPKGEKGDKGSKKSKKEKGAKGAKVQKVSKKGKSFQSEDILDWLLDDAEGNVTITTETVTETTGTVVDDTETTSTEDPPGADDSSSSTEQEEVPPESESSGAVRSPSFASSVLFTFAAYCVAAAQFL